MKKQGKFGPHVVSVGFIFVDRKDPKLPCAMTFSILELQGFQCFVCV
jgi:hypothetical protein